MPDAEPSNRYGFLLVDKPKGPTSHDIVALIRGKLLASKVGHGGTLDPMASGLLIIMVGKATKLAPFIPGDPKVYGGRMVLGLATDSMDLQGNVVSRRGFKGDSEQVREALNNLKGEIEQQPPMFSAAKFKGKPLYHYARLGKEIPRRTRTVRVYEVKMTRFVTEGGLAESCFTLSCSPGTYVRDLVSRVGEALGCGATLSGLRRTASGPFGVEEAVTVDEFVSRSRETGIELMPPLRALGQMPRVVVGEELVKAVRNGSNLDERMLGGTNGEFQVGKMIAVVDPQGSLLGVHQVTGKRHFSSRPIRIL